MFKVVSMDIQSCIFKIVSIDRQSCIFKVVSMDRQCSMSGKSLWTDRVI